MKMKWPVVADHVVHLVDHGTTKEANRNGIDQTVFKAASWGAIQASVVTVNQQQALLNVTIIPQSTVTEPPTQ